MINPYSFNQGAIQRLFIKQADDVVFTPDQVKYQLRQHEKRKKDLNRPIGSPMLGGAALIGGGAAAYGAGELMNRTGNISFNQLQQYLNTVGNKGPNSPAQPFKEKIKELARIFTSPPTATGAASEIPTANLTEGLAKDMKEDPSTLQSFIPGIKLKDVNVDSDPKIPDAVASTFDAPDSFRSLLGYTEAGHRLLADKPYKNTTGYDMVKWFRSPANSWWRQDVPGQEGMFRVFDKENTFVPSWDNTGPGQMHYKSFSVSPARALRQFTFENKGSLDQVIDRLAEARKQTVLSLLGKQNLKPEDVMKAYSDTTANTVGEFASPLTVKDFNKGINSIKDVGGFFKNTIAPISTSPLLRNKHEASARIIADALEKNLGATDNSIASLLKGNDASAIAGHDYKGDISRALGIGGAEGMKTRINALLDRADSAIKANNAVDPRAQVDAMYGALKDDPMAHVLGLGPHHDIPYPLAASMYGSLQKATKVPGLIAHGLMSASPWVKGVGLGLGTAGAGLGIYGLINWMKKQRAKKELERAAVRTPSLHPAVP